jgi:ATP-dependent DNA ligase
VALDNRYRLRPLHSFPERHITPDATEELKLDGYRALAINSAGRVQLRSRNDNDFSMRYPAIVKALASLPSETVIDGEVVALD